MELLDLPWWALVLVPLGLTHITIAAVTIFLHRHQAHRALSLHPIVSHFFRFWLWLTTGMVTKGWVAVHRKHHAKCETQEDPHSPRTFGIRTVLLRGAELYRVEATNAETLEKYGVGTPDDWLERHLYGKRPMLGIAILLVSELALFGPIGLTIWAVQMLWIPLLAAGVINGIGHYWGYRSFATRDASRNILPWGILIGGEELHNNHHAYSTSARLSNRWWEFDIGWAYIRSMEIVRLAKVHRVAPKLRFVAGKAACDVQTVQAVIMHRFDVLARFAKTLRRTAEAELRQLRLSDGRESRYATMKRAVKHSLHMPSGELPPLEREALDRALLSSPVLQTICRMRQDLMSLWERSSASKEQLVSQLEAWCQRAEASGIGALGDFSRKLRCYG
ncbi:DesA family fatty acid desaturase [Aromatoleum sp.]|uniref:DesA family fatty acid desaturase n=1 Tax=Aromatoleum sp. TaxID=2307007 RepID=UPI0039C88C46